MKSLKEIRETIKAGITVEGVEITTRRNFIIFSVKGKGNISLIRAAKKQATQIANGMEMGREGFHLKTRGYKVWQSVIRYDNGHKMAEYNTNEWSCGLKFEMTEEEKDNQLFGRAN